MLYLRRLRFICLSLLLLFCHNLLAQRFYNLTAQEVKVDSVLPRFSCSIPLAGNYADSVYSVEIAYPEYIDMTVSDVARCKAMPSVAIPAFPAVEQNIVINRRKASLEVSFCPVVCIDGRYRLLVSFMLDVKSRPLSRSVRRRQRSAEVPVTDRYAAKSVLSAGRWAKIRVPDTGVYQLTESLVRRAGFNDINKVHIYGYGGALLNEKLDGADLKEHDDLKEVPVCRVDGRVLFHAQGPVSWSSADALDRTRNPYSQYGYYFLTQTDELSEPVDSAQFVSGFYPSAADYHWLHEIDNYAWYHGGRNLFEDTPVALNAQQDYTLPPFSDNQNGARLRVCVTAGTATSVEVFRNGKLLGTLRISLGEHDVANRAVRIFNIGRSDVSDDKITIKTISGGPARLDYLSLAYDAPRPAPRLGASFPEPEYVYNITNQNHHADKAFDMVIIVPASQKLMAEANRLKLLHEQRDSFRVKIVPADELYNEFSSGTPDAGAYRRYLKMLYDRAESEADLPRYLLLFGDAVWDNRMLTGATRSLNPDDYLLCFESENSFSELYCYVDDGFFCLLDDGEGINQTTLDKADVAVGRIPVTTSEEARAVVNKIVDYVGNANAGAWQNVLMFMGDDGDDNLHMQDADDAAEEVGSLHPGYQIKKVMWDSYLRESSAVGNFYPGASRDIKQQMANGALIMDYCGHGRADMISHEFVLRRSDFEQFRNKNLPLWITASCDIMAFDGAEPTIGEAAMLNDKGGAVAFWGTTRTVQSSYNKRINMSYLRHVLSLADGRRTTIGEAQRLAKNEMITSGMDLSVNKLQYTLFGDPAMTLNAPFMQAVIDSIDGCPAGSVSGSMQVGNVVRLSGHIDNAPDFDGVVTVTVRDAAEKIVCRLNDRSQASVPFTYKDRKGIIFQGSDSVRAGRFTLSFAVPKDISYSADSGLINVYAVDNGHHRIAHGAFENFTISGNNVRVDSVGPSVYCYLNSPQFVNGGRVNASPYFVAEITDEDGINATGGGIGHDLQLIIDGDMSRTYTLNDNFRFDFGTYTRGSTYYNIPELEEGRHTLTFKAWDVLNNVTTTRLDFEVVRGLEPDIYSIGLSNNPAVSETTFIVNHDRSGSNIDVDIEVFDMSGRLLWTHSEKGITTGSAYTVSWDLSLDGGGRLQTGVYLYRVRMGSDGSKKTSKAKKLIVLGNN